MSENEKRTGISSPFCSVITEKSSERESIRGGVPVFIRPLSKPKSTRHSVRPSAAGSAIRPPPYCFSPMCIIPFKNVPLVRIRVRHPISTPSEVFTPVTVPLLSTFTPVTVSAKRSRPSVCSNSRRHCSEKRYLSHWARGLHIAGPLDILSILNWIPVISVTIPEYPPKASISRTICPLAIPPIAGLQDICAMEGRFCVIRSVDAPIRAAIRAASLPACPPPTTITS